MVESMNIGTNRSNHMDPCDWIQWYIGSYGSNDSFILDPWLLGRLMSQGRSTLAEARPVIWVALPPEGEEEERGLIFNASMVN